MQTPKNAHTLDASDRRLVLALQRDADRSAEALAPEVGLSPSAVRRRMARLKRDGTIAGIVALIDPALAGVEIIVTITMRQESRASYDRLKRRLVRAPEVSQCYSVTGDIDLVAHVHISDMARYEQWIDENILADDAIARCTSHVVYTRVKFTPAVAF